jgi:hypothetical protein
MKHHKKSHHTDVYHEHHPSHHLARERAAHSEHMTDMPSNHHMGHPMSGMGCHEFKGEAMDIAYGQAGKAGCKSDSGKIMSQMKHYDWEGPAEH